MCSQSAAGVSKLGGLQGLSRVICDDRIQKPKEILVSSEITKVVFAAIGKHRLGKNILAHESWTDSQCLSCIQWACVSISSLCTGKHLYSQWLTNILRNIHDVSLCHVYPWLHMNSLKYMNCCNVMYAIIKFSVSSRSLAPRVTYNEI